LISVIRNLISYRELLAVLVWKDIAVRYKQAYLGVAWSILKPVILMLIFTLVRSFVNIDTGHIPYPIMAFAALMPWVLFQEATSQGVTSIVSNAALIRKIYFPREVFPITGLLTKLVELVINFAILAGLMIYYRMTPTLYALWVPLIILYTLMASLVISLAGAAMNVHYRDTSHLLPILFNLLMYASPIIYPMSLVQKTLLENHAAGKWSELFYVIYNINPLAGIIDSFQRTLLKGLPPDFTVLLPGMLLTLLLLPLSYRFFKRAEAYFADII
jgi:lipopolysaccharide transport system permease protein